MRFRQLSLWIGLVAILLSSGCCCHRRCGWRRHCGPACYEPTTCCHSGNEPIATGGPVFGGPVYSSPLSNGPVYSSPLSSAPPLAPAMGPMPSAK